MCQMSRGRGLWICLNMLNSIDLKFSCLIVSLHQHDGCKNLLVAVQLDQKQTLGLNAASDFSTFSSRNILNRNQTIKRVCVEQKSHAQLTMCHFLSPCFWWRGGSRE